MNRPLISLAACVSTMLFAAGCGSDSETADSSDTSTTAAATSSVAVTATSIVTPTTVGTATTADPTVTTADPASATTAAAAGGRVVTSPSENVRKGDTGPGVEQIQTALNAAGYGLGVDGVFGDVTDRAVRDYQGKNGLAVDGIVGPNTWAKLGSAADAMTPTTA